MNAATWISDCSLLFIVSAFCCHSASGSVIPKPWEFLLDVRPGQSARLHVALTYIEIEVHRLFPRSFLVGCELRLLLFPHFHLRDFGRFGHSAYLSLDPLHAYFKLSIVHN